MTRYTTKFKHTYFAVDPNGHWVTYADAQDTVEALRRELLEWKRALCGLTPGGSEFADDHAYCAEWVRKARENQHDIIISKHRKLNATQAALDAEREKVKELEANQAEYEKCTDEQIVALNQGCLDYEKELSQLQALVRAYCEAKVTFDDGRLREDHHAWKERFERLTTAEQALIATLPATPTERGEDHSGDDTDMVQKAGGDGE